MKQTIEYLGYNVTSSKITLSPRHTQAVADFPAPKKILELQRFLGLVNYFRRFIKDYAIKTKSLYNLLRKNSKFLLNDECLAAFDSIKKKLTTSGSRYI